MDINKQNVKTLIDEKFNGSMYKAAQTLGVSYSGIFKIMKSDRKAGKKTITSIIKYCQDNGLDYERYIFLQ